MDNFYLKGMNRAYPDESMVKFAEHLRYFLSEKERERSEGERGGGRERKKSTKHRIRCNDVPGGRGGRVNFKKTLTIYYCCYIDRSILGCYYNGLR